MLKDLANAKYMLTVENANQYTELVSICSENDISLCKISPKKRTYPVYFCFLEVLKTGDVYLVPETNSSELKNLGWQPYQFKAFKQLVSKKKG